MAFNGIDELLDHDYLQGSSTLLFYIIFIINWYILYNYVFKKLITNMVSYIFKLK